MKPGTQFIFAAFIIMVSFLVLFVVSILAAIPFVGFSEMLESLSGANLTKPSAIALLKYFQVIQSIGMFVLPPFIIAYLYDGNVVKYLKLDKVISLKIFLIGILAVIASGPFVAYLGEINEKLQLPGFLSGVEEWMRTMEESAAAIIERFIQVETVWGLLFNIFMIAVIPAVGEELLFRGVIQKIFTNMTRNYHLGIWISAFLFSALHMQFFGFLPRMFLGAVFGYLLVYSGSIWLPILAHFLNNAVGVLALHAEHQGNDTISTFTDYADSFGTSTVAALLGLLVAVLLLLILKKGSLKRIS